LLFPRAPGRGSLASTAIRREAAVATPRERGDGGEQDSVRVRLDQIININHALARLAQVIGWPVPEGAS